LSGNVDSGSGRSGVVENMKVVVGSSMIFHSISEKPCISGLTVVFETNSLVSGHVDPRVT
jgi:hypothetical protein